MIDPQEISTAFKKAGQLQKVFKYIGKSEYGDSVMHVLDQMQCLHIMPDIERETKCKYKSLYLRNEGNRLFKQNELDKAMQHYNLALVFAPKDSKAFKLALGNRSALLLRLGRLKAAEIDIEKALGMGVQPDVKEKLLNRLEKCRELKEPKANVTAEDLDFCQKLLQVKDSKNDSIPCATSSVEMKMKNGKRVIAATKAIDVGEVISVESPYASHISKENQSVCCHYCHKYSDNLMPCDSCCVTMFCSDSCRDLCWSEFHSVECDMMSVCAVLPNQFRLSLKAVIKARKSCASWRDFMDKVKNTNEVDKEKLGFVKNEFGTLELDSRNYESICTQAPFKDNAALGFLFDFTVFAAIAVHALSEIFMDDVTEKNGEVKKFIGHQILFHAAAGIVKHISCALSVSYNLDGPDAGFSLPNKAIGFFAFSGLLPHSCFPNTMCFGLDNKLVMIASKPIPEGAELITCYGVHFLMMEKEQRAFVLQKNWRMTCTCEPCERKWKTETLPTHDITQEQDKYIIGFLLAGMYKVNSLEEAVTYYPLLCQGLRVLHNKPKSQYVKQIYMALVRCIQYMQFHLAPHYMKGEILSIENTLKMITLTKKKV